MKNSNNDNSNNDNSNNSDNGSNSNNYFNIDNGIGGNINKDDENDEPVERNINNYGFNSSSTDKNSRIITRVMILLCFTVKVIVISMDNGQVQTVVPNSCVYAYIYMHIYFYIYNFLECTFEAIYRGKSVFYPVIINLTLMQYSIEI